MTEQDRQFRKAVGARLIALRHANGWGQREVAERIRITQRALSNYETGKREVPLSTAIAIADLYGVSVGYLVGEEVAAAALMLAQGPRPSMSVRELQNRDLMDDEVCDPLFLEEKCLYCGESHQGASVSHAFVSLRQVHR